MDYENVTNISDWSLDSDIPPEISSEEIIYDVLFAIFCLIGILADSLIIYTIFKFQRLRTVSNILLANWAISDIFSLIIGPSGFRLFSALENIKMPHTFFCILLNAGIELHSNIMMFLILVCINWALDSYFSTCYAVIKKYYLVVISLPWLITLVLFSISMKDCFSPSHSHLFLSHAVLCCTVLFGIGLVIFLQVTRAITICCRKPSENSALAINLATLNLACYAMSMMLSAPVFLRHFLQLMFNMLIFSSSIINISLLYYHNQDFQTYLRQVLKCSCNQEAPLSFENPTVRVKIGNSSDEVLFNNPNNAFLKREM